MIVSAIMRRPDGQSIFLGSTVALAVAVILGFAFWSSPDGQAVWDVAERSQLGLDDIPFDGRRSYEFLSHLCQLGPRYSGSPGMIRQRALLESHFRNLGAEVRRQEFTVRHPVDGSPVEMANLIVHWHPQRSERILLCAHYDTRPFPDRDPNPSGRQGTFVGANDGASGVAVLAELARWMPRLDTSFGVDFVLFDGEEFVFDDARDTYFLGSRHFAHDHVQNPNPQHYRCGILLDMVGDLHLELYQERHSVRWPDTRPLVQSVWQTAQRLGVKEFIPRPRHEVRDDHVILHDLAGIPTCNIIDFDYNPPGRRQSYWHTQADTPDKCSPLSLAKVGWVVWRWLEGPASGFLERSAASSPRPPARYRLP